MWKETVHVSGPGGCFQIDHTYGETPMVYLPSEQDWLRIAPPWALDQWPLLRDELDQWCKKEGILLVIDPTGRHQALGLC